MFFSLKSEPVCGQSFKTELGEPHLQLNCQLLLRLNARSQSLNLLLPPVLLLFLMVKPVFQHVYPE